MNRESAVDDNRAASMPKARRSFTNEFRQEAVNLLLSSGRTLKRVAEELGITPNSLRTWRDKALGNGRSGQAEAAAGAPVADAAAEIRRLQRENEYLRRQREILKKAMSILSEDPQSGMR